MFYEVHSNNITTYTIAQTGIAVFPNALAKSKSCLYMGLDDGLLNETTVIADMKVLLEFCNYPSLTFILSIDNLIKLTHVLTKLR